MSRAAAQIFVTQSALSLQMKRLTDIVQTPIFHKHHRGVLLTPAGETLLGYARAMLELNEQALSTLNGVSISGPVRVGMVQDFADTLLTSVLVRFAKHNRGAQLQIRVGNSAELLNHLSAGFLDVVLCLGPANDPAAIAIAPMVWLGQPSVWNEPILQVALMEKPCVFREAALAALEASGRAFVIVLETPSISVLRAAVESGLGVTCRTSALFGRHTVPLKCPTFSLPKVAYSLHTASNAPQAIKRLVTLMSDSITRFSVAGQEEVGHIVWDEQYAAGLINVELA